MKTVYGLFSVLPLFGSLYLIVYVLGHDAFTGEVLPFSTKLLAILLAMVNIAVAISAYRRRKSLINEVKINRFM